MQWNSGWKKELENMMQQFNNNFLEVDLPIEHLIVPEMENGFRRRI